MGTDFIQTHIDADTVRVLGKAAHLCALVFVGIVILAGAVLALDLHGLVWASTNYWPVFLSLLFPFVTGMMLFLLVAAWLLARAATIYVSKRQLQEQPESECVIEPAQNPVELSRVDLDAKVAELALDLPGISFGYIGNLEHWGDDRAWAVFLPHPGRVGGPEDSVWLGETSRLPQAAAKWESIAATARSRYHLCTRS